MHGFWSITYLAVLVVCTLIAVRTWYARRGTKDEAEKKVFARFVLGIAIFWLVAVAGYLAGVFSFAE